MGLNTGLIPRRLRMGVNNYGLAAHSDAVSLAAATPSFDLADTVSATCLARSAMTGKHEKAAGK